MKSDKKSNIVLIGFMASGKSRIGEMLARMLDYNICDTDQLIEEAQGKSIEEIFLTKGEEYFRRLESEMITSLKGSHRSVIVSGGGAPMRFDNAQMLARLGQMFFLDASLPLIIDRLRVQHHRPLAWSTQGIDQERLRNLYRYRRPIYLDLAKRIDVNDQNQERICQEIIKTYRAHERLNARPHTPIDHQNHSYQIFHFAGAIDHAKDIIDSAGLSDHRPVIVTSDRLKDVLHSSIKRLAHALSCTDPIVVMGDGERHKNSASVQAIHRSMFALGLNRKTLMIAIGGGTVTDVAGFAAAIYMRGIPIVQVPSTLLSMVDASIGGKTGIDVEQGKNLIGAFHHPRSVIIDPHLLASLPQEDFSSGMAEVIKHAIILDRDLFFSLLNDEHDLMDIIERAIRVKAQMVSSDPHEQGGDRIKLNLGHTFAHAIEKVSDYQIKHGQAVAMGLVLAFKLSKNLGLLREDFYQDLIDVLQKFNLPIELPKGIAVKDLLPAMKLDKKRDARGLLFILPIRIGEVGSQYVDDDTIFSGGL